MKKDKDAPKESETFVNPIDKDKIAENPHLLPYAHTVGGAVIKPIDKGRTKGLAMTAMYEQTDMQLDQIREQVELLVAQAQLIHHRVEISQKIYEAEINFVPLIGKTYHLYKRNGEQYVVSMVGPSEWGRSSKLEFVATMNLLADHTWEVVGDGNLDI